MRLFSTVPYTCSVFTLFSFQIRRPVLYANFTGANFTVGFWFQDPTVRLYARAIGVHHVEVQLLCSYIRANQKTEFGFTLYATVRYMYGLGLIVTVRYGAVRYGTVPYAEI